MEKYNEQELVFRHTFIKGKVPISPHLNNEQNSQKRKQLSSSVGMRSYASSLRMLSSGSMKGGRKMKSSIETCPGIVSGTTIGWLKEGKRF